MTEAIAIDFGTTRTKVAYWDERNGAPRLANLGYGDKPEVPSLFHLSRDSDQISWGYDAEELLEEDPAGIVEVLKRRLQDRYVYANHRKVSPLELLTLMFRRLREQVGQEVLALDGTPPAKACLTLPALYGPAVEKLLREAAQAADFTDVELIPEPVAAAQAWLTEASETGRSVVVLDCGGGTLDLAYLGYEDGQFRIISECPPGGDTHVGGHDVDRELLNLLREQLPDADAADELEERQPFYLRQVRVLKERYCRNLPERPLKVAGQTLELSAKDIQSVLQERFIAQTCESLNAYMARVVALTGAEKPPVLLVGGSARIKGLREVIEAQVDCRTLWWERSEFATVLGAMSTSSISQPSVSPELVSAAAANYVYATEPQPVLSQLSEFPPVKASLEKPDDKGDTLTIIPIRINSDSVSLYYIVGERFCDTRLFEQTSIVPECVEQDENYVYEEKELNAVLQLLRLLQQEGKLIDFLQEDVSKYSDAEIGAAARVIHEGCRKVLRKHFTLDLVSNKPEGARVALELGFGASNGYLISDAVGNPPYTVTGTLCHRGWRVTQANLPKFTESFDEQVLAPIEIDIHSKTK